MCDRILHIMSDHHSCQMVTVDDHFCDFKYFGCGLRVEGSSMLIQKQKLWFLQCSHQKCQCLTLSTGEKSDLGSKTVFQSET